MKFTAITENHLYQKAYRKGQRKSSATLGVFVLKDKHAPLLQKQHPLKKRINRIGISASKKVGGAVQRNRAKRVIREAYRQIDREIGIKTGYLVVITPYPKAAQVKMQDVKRDLRYCLARLDMLPPKDAPKAPETETSGMPKDAPEKQENAAASIVTDNTANDTATGAVL
ncbi:MAG: ribonuclease P protein component [Clostridia bacterium]|nr:ribonuclease P protein component [Clostridia bacterium]